MTGKCKQHGVQRGVFVSPDLAAAVKTATPITGIVKVQYEDKEEELKLVFYLSRTYAEQYGITEDTTLPLIDDVPDYLKSPRTICKKCLLEYIENEGLSIET